MDSAFLSAVVAHLRPLVVGASVAKVWQPSAASLVVDLKLADGRFLYLSCNPADPELFLTARSIASIETAAPAERAFAALVRKRLRGARVGRVARHPDDRVVAFDFAPFVASGTRELCRLVVALTGRSANAYLVDDKGDVLGSLRPMPEGTSPPVLPEHSSTDRASVAPSGAWISTMRTERGERLVLGVAPHEPDQPATAERFPDPSAAADERARRLDAARTLANARSGLRARARAAHDRAERLTERIRDDMRAAAGHERDRELAESLLAQLASAQRVRGGLSFTDLHSPDQRTVLVPCEDADTPRAVAERLFAKQRKAKRTREKAGARLVDVLAQRDALAAVLGQLDAATSLADLSAAERALDALLGVRRITAAASRARTNVAVRGARRYVSSDGYEILVGRSASANDSLTFKTARPGDVWLHTADYPGSHVVIRNPIRRDVPHRTLREAAQLAAFYSEARNNALVDVRYTPRRYVTKPRGAAPGLVRLSQFKTIAVAPAADLDRAQDE